MTRDRLRPKFNTFILCLLFSFKHHSSDLDIPVGNIIISYNSLLAYTLIASLFAFCHASPSNLYYLFIWLLLSTLNSLSSKFTIRHYNCSKILKTLYFLRISISQFYFRFSTNFLSSTYTLSLYSFLYSPATFSYCKHCQTQSPNGTG